MAITQGLCTSFKVQMLNAEHAFGTTVVRASTTPDVFKIALYTSAADLGPNTTVYTTSGEVPNGSGYTTGGKTLTSTQPSSSEGVAYLDFSDAVWNASSITARGALIYNSTQGNKAVAVLNFGADRQSSSGDFIVQFPANNAGNAIIRVT